MSGQGERTTFQEQISAAMASRGRDPRRGGWPAEPGPEPLPLVPRQLVSGFLEISASQEKAFVTLGEG